MVLRICSSCCKIVVWVRGSRMWTETSKYKEKYVISSVNCFQSVNKLRISTISVYSRGQAALLCHIAILTCRAWFTHILFCCHVCVHVGDTGKVSRKKLCLAVSFWGWGWYLLLFVHYYFIMTSSVSWQGKVSSVTSVFILTEAVCFGWGGGEHLESLSW